LCPRNFREFPVSIVVTYDRSIHGGDIAPFDCGAVTNALVNAAWSRGLGCVINSQGIMQSPVVRELPGECGGVTAEVGGGRGGVCGV